MKILFRLWLKRTAWMVCALLITLSVLLAGLAFVPQTLAPLVMEPKPVESFEQAVAKAGTLLVLAPGEVRPECRATILDHGRKTDRVYVLMHGFTNCPAQFMEFAKLLHATGANVLLPRLPYHGYVEGLDYRQRGMTDQSMLDSACPAVDLAHGYGEKITIIGLSVNGTTAAWLAQMRDDVDTAMIIAPFFAPYGVSSGWVNPLGRLISRLPNRMIWWDPATQADIEGPEHAFARFATHPIAAVMRMGRDTFDRAEKDVPPKAKRIIFVTSEVDKAINADLVDDLAARWKRTAPGTVSHQVFPAEANIPHDAIDPAQPGSDVGYVYPKLMEWLGND